MTELLEHTPSPQTPTDFDDANKDERDGELMRAIATPDGREPRPNFEAVPSSQDADTAVPSATVGEEGPDTRRRRSEAGRKGGHRVHQLLEAGRLYEKEHGLTSGRQRLRQLIELGKLYEQEHRLRPRVAGKRPVRMSRTQRKELLGTLVQCLIRIAKPSYRAELSRLLGTLQDVSDGHAA